MADLSNEDLKKLILPTVTDVKGLMTSTSNLPQDIIGTRLLRAGLPATKEMRIAVTKYKDYTSTTIGIAADIVKKLESDTSVKDIETLAPALCLMGVPEDVDLVKDFGEDIAVTTAQLQVLYKALQEGIGGIDIGNLPLPVINGFVGILAKSLDDTLENILSEHFDISAGFLDTMAESLCKLAKQIPTTANTEMKSDFAKSFNNFSMRTGTNCFFSLDKDNGTLKRQIPLMGRSKSGKCLH